MRLLVLVVLLASCPASVQMRPDRIVWSDTPTIGTDDSSLEDDIDWAVSQWGWGSPQSGCEGADICVRRGFLVANGPAGRAEWPGRSNRCDVWVYRPINDPVIVAHEIGHCFGLGHSTHPRSVMYPEINGDDMYWVTYDDYNTLHRNLQ